MVSEMSLLGQNQSDGLVEKPPEESGLPEESQPLTTSNERCDANPDFAVICSFIALFGDKIELELNIEQLKTAIEDMNNLDENLIEIHVKLLKKIRRYFIRDQWEKTLIRFASEFSYDEAYEIERFGYAKTRPSTRIHLLRRLMDAQFECNQKFKATVNLCEANDLRILPLGRDLKGNTYWQRTDKEGSFRIYQEEPLDYKSWKAISTNPEELNYVINELDAGKEEKIKSQQMLEPYNPYPEIFPEYFNKKEEPIKIVTNGNATRLQGRANKSSPLPTLVEVNEQDTSNDILHPPLDNKQIVKDTKQYELDNSQTPSTLSSLNSIDCQVRSTLENLINKVVSTFGNFIRPLSRNSTPEQTDTVPVKQKGRKRQTKKEKPTEEILPRRSSSRIQQLQQKKTAELVDVKNHVEDISKIEICSSKPDNGKNVVQPTKTRKHNQSNSVVNRQKKLSKRRKKSQSWKTRKGGKKWDKDDSDLSSTSSLTPSDADDLDDLEESQNINYDDEFACEDEDTNNEPVILKRARTARPSMGTDESGNQTISFVEEDKPCERCDRSNDPEWILLCDMCDNGYHLACCIPPLMIVPDGDWFCPTCEHKMLLSKLKELYTSITEILDAKERERIKKQKPRQNIIKKEPAPKPEPQRTISEPIEYISDVDTISETDDAVSDESFQASSDTEPEDDDDDDVDDDDEDEETTEVESCDESESSVDELVAIKYTKKVKNKISTRRRRNSYSSDESDYQPSRGRRRAAAAQVSYKESTDEEDEIAAVQPVKKPKKSTLSSDESHASWKSHENTSVADDDDLTENDDDIRDDNNEDQTNNNNGLENNDNSDCIKLDPDQGKHDELDTEFDNINHALSCAKSIELEIDDVERSIDLERQNELKVSEPPSTQSMNRLTESLYQPLTSTLTSYIPCVATTSQTSNYSSADPMDQLNQYCNDSSGPVTSMFKSYNDILSKRNPAFASKHPPFYSEDVANPPNKQ